MKPMVILLLDYINICSYSNIMKMEKVFRALAERNRIRIALLLEMGPLNVSEIVSVLGLSQSNVSHHLKLLLEAGVVKRSGRANWVFYSRSTGSPIVDGLVKTAFQNRTQLLGFQEDMNRLAHCHALRRNTSMEFFNSVDEKGWNSLVELLPQSDEYLPFIRKSIGNRELTIEVGAGSGNMIPFLLESTDKILAIDNSREMLGRAHKFLTAHKITERVELRLGDAEHLPSADSMADAAFIHMLLHHSGNPRQTVEEAFRVLKPGGILVLIDLLEHSDASFKEEQGDLWPGFTRDRVKSFITDSGLSILEESTFNNGTVIAIAAMKGNN